MSGGLASETKVLTHLLETLAPPAYVTDRLNRVRAVNRAFAMAIGDPLRDGLYGDDLFVQSLILGPYRARFPRRYDEIAGCMPTIVGEIECGALAPEVGQLLQKALQQDVFAARTARNALEGHGSEDWDGAVRFLTRDGVTEEFSETVVPLSLDAVGGPSLFLNVWTKPSRPPILEQAGLLLTLSRREHEAAALYAAGYSTPDVAVALGISVHTAGDHRDNIYSKLGIHSRAELGRLFTR